MDCRDQKPLIIAPTPVSPILRMFLGLKSMERTQTRWIAVELKHIRSFKTEFRDPKIANHAWPNHYVSNFNNVSIIAKSNYRLESCRNLGTPRRPVEQLLTLDHSQHNKALFFSKQKFLSLFPLKFIRLYSFLSRYIGFTVCRPRQAEHPHIQLEGQSAYHRDSDIISNFVNPTIATASLRTLLKGTVPLRVKLKATVVDSNC